MVFENGSSLSSCGLPGFVSRSVTSRIPADLPLVSAPRMSVDDLQGHMAIAFCVMPIIYFSHGFDYRVMKEKHFFSILKCIEKIEVHSYVDKF